MELELDGQIAAFLRENSPFFAVSALLESYRGETDQLIPPPESILVHAAEIIPPRKVEADGTIGVVARCFAECIGPKPLRFPGQKANGAVEAGEPTVEAKGSSVFQLK